MGNCQVQSLRPTVWRLYSGGPLSGGWLCGWDQEMSVLWLYHCFLTKDGTEGSNLLFKTEKRVVWHLLKKIFNFAQWGNVPSAESVTWKKRDCEKSWQAATERSSGELTRGMQGKCRPWVVSRGHKTEWMPSGATICARIVWQWSADNTTKKEDLVSSPPPFFRV